MQDISEIKELALFRLDEDVFGIDINHIQEINKNLSFTKVYRAADYVKGVMNLRGQIVTVIDLRLIFRYVPNEMRSGNRVIIVRYKNESVGFLVDKMEDILNVDPGKLENSAAKIAGVNENYFSGIYKEEGELVVILDVDQILYEEESSKAVA